jgi:plasmid stabilization system protein ParE
VKVRWHESARDELREAVRYYNAERKGLGSEFRDEVKHGVNLISRHPQAWQTLQGPIRRITIRRFPYGIIFEVRNDDIRILAIAHLHRRPEYWSDRT